MTFKGIDLTPILTGLVLVIGLLIQKAIAAVGQAKETDNTLKKLEVLGLAIAGDVWNAMSFEFQAAIADGSISAEERAKLKVLVQVQIEKYTSSEELSKVAKTLGLPVPSVIGWVGEWLIDRFTKAHDQANSEVSSSAYPLTIESLVNGNGTEVGDPDPVETEKQNPNAYQG